MAPPGKPKWTPKGSQDALGEQVDKKAKKKGGASNELKYDKLFMLKMKRSAELEIVADSEVGLTAKVVMGKQKSGKDPTEIGKLTTSMDEVVSDLQAGAVPFTPSQAPETPSAGVDMTQQLSDAGYQAGMYSSYLNSMAIAMNSAMSTYGAGGCTTVMLRNVPNRYTRDMLTKRLDFGYKGQYDFVYLPIDFNSKFNVGYAFINFRTPLGAYRFLSEFHNMPTQQVLPGFSSKKVCEVSFARVQGRDANLDNLADGKFLDKLTDRAEWQPLFLDENGDAMPFADVINAGAKRRGSKPGSTTPTTGAMAAATPGSAMAGFMMSPYTPMLYPQPPVPPPSATMLPRVLPNATEITMLMLRGVPKKITRTEAIEFLNKSFEKAYDFLFLPVDPKVEGNNRGFLFINFKTQEKAEEFAEKFNKKKTSECFPASEVEDTEAECQVASARLHSLENSIGKLQTAQQIAGQHNSQWLPLLFAPDGEPLDFPLAPPAQDKEAEEGEAAAEGATGEVATQRKERQRKKKEAQEKGGEKGKGKGKGGKKGGADAMMSQGYAADAFGGFGYPGFGMPSGPAAMSYAAWLAQAHGTYSHMMAHAAAAAHAVSGVASGVAKGQGEAGDQSSGLRKQIEFYFSEDNLKKDLYLRCQMDSEGWVKLQLLAGFNMVKNKFKASQLQIAHALAGSTTLQLDDSKTRVRLMDQEARDTWRQLPTDVPG